METFATFGDELSYMGGIRTASEIKLSATIAVQQTDFLMKDILAKHR